MNLHRAFRAAFAAGGLACAAAAPVSAAVVVTGAQVGDDYVFSFSGSLDITGSQFFPVQTNTSVRVEPSLGEFWSVRGDYLFGILGTYGEVFGDGAVPGAGVATGDNFHFSRYYFAVPADYVSGAALSGVATFPDYTLASLGLTEGSYVYGLQSGDIITLNIGAMDSGPAADVPLPAAAPLLLAGLGLAGMVGRRRNA